MHLRASFARLLLIAAFSIGPLAQAAPLPREAVPEPLKTWLPWVLHGQEMLACPPAWNDAGERACTWPGTLEIDPAPGRAAFALSVESFAPASLVSLPGSSEHWPQDVTVNGKPAAVILRDETPTLSLPAGRHRIAGRFLWTAMPQNLSVPAEIGIVQVRTVKGLVSRQPDDAGEVWLSAEAADDAEAEAEALSLRSFRRIDDGQPMRVTSRFELTFSGKPREITLEHALLPGFVPLALNSPLPARLGPDGSLRLQARAGVHVIEVEGRHMARLLELGLPKTAAREEIWSWQAHNDLRVVDIAGNTVDPRQTDVPRDWQKLPAYLLTGGDALALTERRRGDPTPDANKLSLRRTLWLDFDGGGYTLRDQISGSLSRTWRLEAGAPLALGHASSDGLDQFITRTAAEAPAGFEVRHGTATILADSRIEGAVRQFKASGWNTDFERVNTELRLPPGWKLLHAGGVDGAQGAWLSEWTLWDAFFVLLITLAAWKTCGRVGGLLLGATLILTWHLPGAPGWLWLAAIGLIAIVRLLPAGRPASVLRGLKYCLAAIILLQALVFSVEQARLALYPALEKTYSSNEFTMGNASLPTPAAPAAMMESADIASIPDQRQMERRLNPVASKSKKGSGPDYSRYGQALDAGAKVQTGPGLTTWHWHQHPLVLQGPVSTEQEIRLWLLPPALHALLRILTLCLLAAAFWQIFLRARSLHLPRQSMTSLAGLVLALALLAPPQADAATPPRPASPAMPAADFQHWLDALQTKLTAAPDCMPYCAELPRLALEADASRLLLRLEIHADQPVAIPLPGQAAQLRLRSVLLDGQPAALRRDEGGQLWASVPAGVHQIVMEADLAEAASVSLTLPLPPRHLDSRLTGWSLSGVDARGAAQGALTLTRASGGHAAATDTGRDALPPLVRVTRALRLNDRWTIATHIERIAPSLAPVEVRVALLPGEQVTDPSVRVADGHALLTLGASNEAVFISALTESPRLALRAGKEPNQVEAWTVHADTRWHVSHEGLAPVQHQDDQQMLLPRWQPWPGEQLSLTITRPQGVPGASLTLDHLKLVTTPGARLTSTSAALDLRSSLGGTHTVLLPEGAELESVTLNGSAQPLRLEGRKLALPITPGSQRVLIQWHENRGVTSLQRSTAFDTGVAGVNASTSLELGASRWILAVGGPRLGPAVLIWGLMIVVLGAALGLSRTRLTPLGVGAWTLLGVGTLQSSLLATLTIVAWFLLLAARGRIGEKLPRWAFNLQQVALVGLSLLAFGVLLFAVRDGLLGSPDMLIEGNNSWGRSLHWYQDRISSEAPQGWAFSVPMWVYRGLMLAWAIWLALGVLRWARWAWQQFASGGLWRAKPPKPVRSEE